MAWSTFKDLQRKVSLVFKVLTSCPLSILNCVDLTWNRSQAKPHSLYYKRDDAVVKALNIVNDAEFSLDVTARAKGENSVIKVDGKEKIDIIELTELFD